MPRTIDVYVYFMDGSSLTTVTHSWHSNKLIFYLDNNILLRKTGVKWELFVNSGVKLTFSIFFFMERLITFDSHNPYFRLCIVSWKTYL